MGTMAFGIVLCVAGVFLVTVITFHLDRAAPYHLSYGVRVTDGLLIIVLYVVVSSAAITPGLWSFSDAET